MALNTAIMMLLAALKLDGTVFPPQATLTDGATYDYIIVGGGTAGCVLARRLAEDKKHSVLVLEEGENPTSLSFIPSLFSTLPKTNLDYDDESTYDDLAASSQGNYTRLTSGKALGGSSVLNHFLYLRTVPDDYNNWADITGKDWWEYENLLPYFKKAETLHEDKIKSKYPDGYGTDGPIGLTRQLHDDYVADYLTALAEAGNPTVLDLNNDKFVGYTQPLLTIADKIRQTPALKYLNSIKGYSNLHVSRQTTVTKVIFEDKTAVAVEAVYKDVTYTLKANKEIILSAGAFYTPKILLLSGVGPTDHLTSLDIDVISDLPVGENLIIPPAVSIVHKTKKHTILPSLGNIVEVVTDPVAIPFPLLVGSAAVNKSNNIPDYQTYNLMLPHNLPYLTIGCSMVYGFKSEICASLQKQVASRDSMYTVLTHINPLSRGTVRLNSNNPSDRPVITTGFYTNSEDLENMVDYVEDFIKIGKTATFQKMDAALVGVDFAECADEEYGTREFWKCYILKRNIGEFFYMGTCPMGTVVDGELKVIGMENLRVIDASVFPEPMHGVTNAAVIALAEKGAELIKNSA